MAGGKIIFVRPFAEELVTKLLSKYRVTVWTASYGIYTDNIIEYFFGSRDNLGFVWGRRECEAEESTNGSSYFVKDLRKLDDIGWHEGCFCIVDDRREYFVGLPQFVVSIKPYFGSDEDEELTGVMGKIEGLKLYNNGKLEAPESALKL